MSKLVLIKSKSKCISYKIKGCFDCPFLDERTFENKPSEFYCCVKGIDKEFKIESEDDEFYTGDRRCPLPSC